MRTRNKTPRRAAFQAGAVLAAAGLGALYAPPAQANHHIDLVCPCRVESAGMTAVELTFGLRHAGEENSGAQFRVELVGRRAGSHNDWETLTTVSVSAADAASAEPGETYTAAFREPQEGGAWELGLRVFEQSSSNIFGELYSFPIQSIYWIAETVDLQNGGSSFSRIYFDGAPGIEIAGEQVTLNLPAIRIGPRRRARPQQSAGAVAPGTEPQDEVLNPFSSVGAITAVLIATPTAAFDSTGTRLAEHPLGTLPPGGELARSSVTLGFTPPAPDDYLHVAVLDDGGGVLAYQTVRVPAGSELPDRSFSTADASMLVDSDGDGEGDVNERLQGTDPNDPDSFPGEAVIDVLALYSPGMAELYSDDAVSRISHVMTLADTIFRDSGVKMRLRLVGIAEAHVDDSRSFADVDADELDDLTGLHGADMAIMFRPFVEGSGLCGWAPTVGGYAHNGVINEFAQAPLGHVFGDCGALTTAHELGHLMGLGHSHRQNERGTFRWSRGHGVWEAFVTVMAYNSAYGGAPGIDLFSSPNSDCDGQPCGIAAGEDRSADAVRSLNIVRFQLESINDPHPDSDGDGFVDPVDAFPNDPAERLDTDGDGIGNNADPDQDNDGVVNLHDLYPLDPVEWNDADGDGVGDNADAFPYDRGESSDTDGDGVGDNSDAFPDDPAETIDTDNDGVGNNADALPFDSREWLDSDGDGIGDNADPDLDNDGVANGIDVHPLDAARSESYSYRINLPHGSNQSMSLSSAGDIDDDGRADFLINAVHFNFDTQEWKSAAYLIAAGDLPAADAADGATDRIVDADQAAAQASSWKFVDMSEGSYGGIHSIAMVGDVNGDEAPELLIGAPYHREPGSARVPGAAYLISMDDLATADGADGAIDGVVQLDLIPSVSGAWMFVGETNAGRTGSSVGALGDMDGDGLADLAIGAPGTPWGDKIKGSSYLIAAADLTTADGADGDEDGVIGLDRVAALPNSWKLASETAGDTLGVASPGRHVDKNGNLHLLLSARHHPGPESQTIGAAYVVAMRELAAADAADGSADGVVDLGEAAGQPGSIRITGDSTDAVQHAVSIGDHDGDSESDLLVRTRRRVFFVSGAHLAAADAGDGQPDGEIAIHKQTSPNTWNAYAWISDPGSNGGVGSADIDGDFRNDILIRGYSVAYLLSGNDLASIQPEPGLLLDDIATGSDSWQFWLLESGMAEIALAGDANADGRGDLLFGAEDGSVYLVISTELGLMDAADYEANGVIDLFEMAGMASDPDGDGVQNLMDPDDDNDGVADLEDHFPKDGGEWIDSDGDGVGDNTDAFPENRDEQLDSDGDGIGNNADTDDDNDGRPDQDDEYPLDTDNDGLANAIDTDDDNDGVPDTDDAFPWDATEQVDTDNDGTGDAADTDDDNDGVPDTDDALPLDPGESEDSDGDGVGNNSDAFVDDAAEWADADGDGIGDNRDGDDDNDGVDDSVDAFPQNAGEWADSDDDGIGDNSDAFPHNASESQDSDGDGIGNHADADDDNDGRTDGADAFPLDAARWRLFHYRLAGERARSLTGAALLPAGDLNDDGINEVLVGAPAAARIDLAASAGTLYVASGADLQASDSSDGAPDHRIMLRHLPARPASWALTGEARSDHFGQSIAAAAPADGAGRWLIGAIGRGNWYKGAALAMAPGALADADALGIQDSVTHLGDLLRQPGSWELAGESLNDEAGHSVSVSGDIHADGIADFLIGAPGHGDLGHGAAYLVSGAGLAGADLADGESDGRIELARVAAQAGSFKLVGSEWGTGGKVLFAGDIDGDALSDLLIGAPFASPKEQRSAGVVYVISAAGLPAADLADGEADGVVQIDNAVRQPSSWKLVGETALDFAGTAMATGDIDGDGNLELFIGAPGRNAGAGAVYVIPATRLSEADNADGEPDRVVHLGQVAGLEGVWKLTGEGGQQWSFFRGSAAGTSLATLDTDGDGRVELLAGAPDYLSDGVWCAAPGKQRQPGAVYLVHGGDLASADLADGESTGVVALSEIASGKASWKFVGEATDRLGSSLSGAGDMDGDGIEDLIFGAARQFRRVGDCGETAGNGAAVILSTAELPLADAADGKADGVIDLDGLRESVRRADLDLDGVEDALDDDDDNDGVPDATDLFPADPLEWADHDNDGVGDNADGDDDNDGTPDARDPFPLNPHETRDSDGDGIGDNSDADDDNDGVIDAEDAFPLDPLEWLDSDGDGRGDNSDPLVDPAPADADGDGIEDAVDDDDDNDGAPDSRDLFPLDPSRQDLYFLAVRRAGRVVALGDMDGDGRDDLLASADDTGRVRLLAAGNLAQADIADGRQDRVVEADKSAALPDSWKLIGRPFPSAAFAGDIELDGRADLIIDDLLLSSRELASADAADGEADRIINLSSVDPATQPGVWRLEELDRGDGLFTSFALGDLNADTRDDLLIGLHGSKHTGVVYVISGAQWQAAASQGAASGVIELDRLVGRPGSWKLLGEGMHRFGQAVSAVADIGGDGYSELLIGAPGVTHGTSVGAGVVFVAQSAAMTAADAADGTSDGVIRLGRGTQPQGMRRLVGGELLTGVGVFPAGDFNADGSGDFIVYSEGPRWLDDTVLAVSGADLTGADAADGATDALIELSLLVRQPGTRNLHEVLGSIQFSGIRHVETEDFDRDGLSDILVTGRYSGVGALISGRDLGSDLPGASWEFRLADRTKRFDGAAFAGDINGDGRPELVFTALGQKPGTILINQPLIYILSFDELSTADILDRKRDRVIHLDLIARRWGAE